MQVLNAREPIEIIASYARLGISGLDQLAAAIGAVSASEWKEIDVTPADSGPYREILAAMRLRQIRRAVITLLTLNWQFVDDLGGFVYRLMCRIARDRHDGSDCADDAHRHGDQLGEQTTG